MAPFCFPCTGKGLLHYDGLLDASVDCLEAKPPVSFSIFIKRAKSQAFHSLGLPIRRLSAIARSGGIFLLMYHRILPSQYTTEFVQPGMYVNADTFEQHLLFLKSHFYILKLKELFVLNEKDKRRNKDRSACALTFDDGWRDFYHFAFPLLKKHGLPAAVFLPTSFIGTNRQFWTDRLASLAKPQSFRAPSPSTCSTCLSSSAQTVKNLLFASGDGLEKAIAFLKHRRDEDIEQAIADLEKLAQQPPLPAERLFLSWEEIREMRRTNLVTFGSHTANHRILTTLRDEEIQEEILQSKSKLMAENVADQDFVPFCYPNGNCNFKIAAMIERAGYSLAVTTKKGWNTRSSNSFMLKRIPVHQDITSTDAMFACRMAGFL